VRRMAWMAAAALAASLALAAGRAEEWRAELERRLAALRPAAPVEFVALAEDVMDRADPALGPARDADRALAMRLAALAGAIDLPACGRSAALFLAEHAVDVGDRRRYAAIAAALDPAPDASQGAAERRDAALALMRAFSAYRRGEAAKAREAIASPGASQLLDAHPEVLAGGTRRFLADCDAMRRGGPPVMAPAQVDALHALGAAAAAGGPRSWGEALVGGAMGPLPEVDLSDPKVLFGVDPAECAWRDGRWTRAEPAPAAR
jgi:hypothetical protein